MSFSFIAEGDSGVGAQEKMGWEAYGSQEKRWQEAGEIGKIYVTLCNILQSKKAQRGESQQK